MTVVTDKKLIKELDELSGKITSQVSDDVEVKDAELKDGLLKVSLKRIVPEGKEARQINIK